MYTDRPFADAKGIYLLCIVMPGPKEITIGKNAHYFNKGYYYYAGSAHGSGGLAARLNRHCSPDKKKHWHIDYLLEHAVIWRIFTWEAEKILEHQLANTLAANSIFSSPVKRFGSSDCGCASHLFFTPGKPKSLNSFLQQALPGIRAVSY